MKKYNIHEAKTHLSKIIQQVSEGEVVYLARAGKVVAEIKAVEEKKRKPFPFGKYKGKIHLEDDWDSEETNLKIAKTFFQENIEDPNSPDEVDGEVHPKYRDFFYGKSNE